MKSKGMNTKLISFGREQKYCMGGVNAVVQRASSIIFDSVSQKKHATQHRGEGALFYGRRGTLTHFSFQDAMSEIEGGAGCVLYPCGAAAIANSILSFVKTGDHLLMTAGAYEPTQAFCETILKDIGVETTYYCPMAIDEISPLIQANTRVVFLESPSSITMEIPDISAIVQAIRIKQPDAIIMIDNTWAAGVLFSALAYDIDISIQAGTKYIIGHSDAMIGTAVANERCWAQLRERSYLMGQMVDADTAYLAARGLRTLGVRLKQHHDSGIAVAEWLNSQSFIARVNHPALPGSVGHEFYRRDFSGSSGLFSFELNIELSALQLEQFLDHFTHFKMAFSWGGFESLILGIQPHEMKKMRLAGHREFNGTLFRVHIGLEDVEDLIDDLKSGFQRIGLMA